MRDIGQRLTAAIDAAVPRLMDVVDPAVPLMPGKWSAKQMVGHLLDSCAVNHERLLRALGTDELVMLGYPQDEWVAAQGYQDAEWSELVTLLGHGNRRFAAVIARTSADDAERQRARHNLHEIGWASWPSDRPGTLRWLMADYVDHLEHHLAQILEP